MIFLTVLSVLCVIYVGYFKTFLNRVPMYQKEMIQHTLSSVFMLSLYIYLMTLEAIPSFVRFLLIFTILNEVTNIRFVFKLVKDYQKFTQSCMKRDL